MSFLNLTQSNWRTISPSRSVAKGAFYVGVLLLPGSLIVMPLLWWLDRRMARKSCSGA